MPSENAKFIKTGEGEGGVMRARDVEFALQGVDVHPQIKQVLCNLAEINHVNMKAIGDLAAMFDQMVDTMNGVVAVTGQMKKSTERLNTFIGNVDADVPGPERKDN